MILTDGGKKSLRISELKPIKTLRRLLIVISFKFSTFRAMFFTACCMLAGFKANQVFQGLVIQLLHLVVNMLL